MNNDKAIHRLFQYIESKGYKPTRLEKEIGLSNGYSGTQLKRNADLGESVLNKIVDFCLDIDPYWLLTGRGSMLSALGSTQVVGSTDLERDNMVLKGVIAEKNAEIRQLNREIGSLEEKLGARGQGASPRFYSTRKSDEPNVPDVSGTHDNPHVAPAIPPKRDGRQTARK